MRHHNLSNVTSVCSASANRAQDFAACRSEACNLGSASLGSACAAAPVWPGLVRGAAVRPINAQDLPRKERPEGEQLALALTQTQLVLPLPVLAGAFGPARTGNPFRRLSLYGILGCSSIPFASFTNACSMRSCGFRAGPDGIKAATTNDKCRRHNNGDYK